jgi:hypothetical protein
VKASLRHITLSILLIFVEEPEKTPSQNEFGDFAPLSSVLLENRKKS